MTTPSYKVTINLKYWVRGVPQVPPSAQIGLVAHWLTHIPLGHDRKVVSNPLDHPCLGAGPCGQGCGTTGPSPSILPDLSSKIPEPANIHL